MDSSEDLSSNPWAQPSQGGSDNTRTSAPSNNDEKVARDSSKHSQLLLTGKVEGDTSKLESEYNVWTSEAQSSYQYRQPTSENIQHTTVESAEVLLDNLDAENEEFGDFVAETIWPIEETGPRVLNPPLATITKDHSANHETSNPDEIHYPWSNGAQFYDPYQNLGSLKSRPVKVPDARINQATEDNKSLSYMQTRAPKSKPKQPAVDVPYETEEWGDFSPDPRESMSFEAANKAVPIQIRQDYTTPATTRSRILSQSSTEDAVHSSFPQLKPSPVSLPPSNIPPPSFLIIRLATLIQTLPSQVNNVLQRMNSEQISQKALDKALRSCIASLRVAARVIAGRKLRWKRDNRLSQSMSIGPAQGAKKGGMKLTGVDKAESQREDREVIEFVRNWKLQLGNIRGALAPVNSQIPGSALGLPEIIESMSITVVKNAEGASVDLKACALCGLKRNERVVRVDVDVWDTFGEWWAELWGHMECREFWEQHQKSLSI